MFSRTDVEYFACQKNQKEKPKMSKNSKQSQNLKISRFLIKSTIFDTNWHFAHKFQFLDQNFVFFLPKFRCLNIDFRI